MHQSRAVAAASATLLLFATAARAQQSLNPIERRVFRSICDAITCVKTNCGGVQPLGRGVVASLFGAILSLTANAASADEPLKLPDSQLEPVKWTQVAGWTTDDHLAAFAAYQTSCRGLRNTRRTEDGRRLSGALWSVCHKALGFRPQFEYRSHLLRAEFSTRAHRASGRNAGFPDRVLRACRSRFALS